MRPILSLAALVATSLPHLATAQLPPPPACACVLVNSTPLPVVKSGIGTVSGLGSCTYVPDAGCVVSGSITLNYSPVSFTYNNGFFTVPSTFISQPSPGTNTYNHSPPAPVACDGGIPTWSYLSINGQLNGFQDGLVAYRQWSCQ